MRRFSSPILVVLALLMAFFCLAYPLYVIQPFRPQGPRELALALAVIRIRPLVMALAGAAAMLFLVLYWRRQHRIRSRILAGMAVLAVLACAALSRVNVYELMFHPLGPPSFETVGETKLDVKEMVVAVNIGGASRAYPIRIISYHHIANDTVGGVPIVATY